MLPRAMALQTDAKQFMMTIRDAEKVRSRYTSNSQQLIRRYFGNYFRSDRRDKPVPENMIFSFLANLMPKLVYDHPRVMVKAEQAKTHEPIAAAMRHVLDAWIERADVRDELERIAYDFAFGYGVAKVGLEERGDYASDPSRGIYQHFNMLALQPYLVRINPDAFVIDPTANSVEEARWMGHQFVRDLDELANDTRYDQSVVAKLSGLQDDEIKFGNRPQEQLSKGMEGSSNNRVALFEIFIVESRQIGTLVSDQNGETAWIQPLTEFNGPEDGPYVVFGAYCVPNHIFPLSPIAAMAEQFMDLNAHASAAAVEAASHKKLVLVDSTQKNLKSAIHQAPSGSVVAIAGLAANAVANIELGGTSAARMTYMSELRERLDRVIGFSDAMRGKNAGNTATETRVVAEAGDNRTEFINLKFQLSVREALTRVGWYFFYEPSIVQPVSWTDASGQTAEGTFLGGIQPGQEELSYNEFALTVDPYSMRRTDPAIAQMQAQQVADLAMTIGPAMMQMPWMNWRAIVEMYGEAMNIPDLTSKLFTEQGLMMMGAGVLPGMLPGVDGNTQAGMQPNMSQHMQAGAAGAPVNNRPMAMGQQAAQMNPGVAAFNQLGYGGRQAMQPAAA
jgi:hypothetical protein